MEKPAFKPQDHFRDLKGKQYLEVRYRVVWFREEHPDGYIATDLVEHDATSGLAVFKARAGYVLPDGPEVYATGYGSETRKDFLDYLEKSETKAVGRALAMLGYGTAQAMELDEDERAVADSPIEEPAQPASAPPSGRGRRAPQAAVGQQPPRPPLAVVPQSVSLDALRQQVTAGLQADAGAREKLPKAAAEMTEAELAKTLAWLTRRARALGGTGEAKAQTTQTTAPPQAEGDPEDLKAELTFLVSLFPDQPRPRAVRSGVAALRTQLAAEPVRWQRAAQSLIVAAGGLGFDGDEWPLARQARLVGTRLMPGALPVPQAQMTDGDLLTHLEKLYEAGVERWGEPAPTGDVPETQTATGPAEAVAF